MFDPVSDIAGELVLLEFNAVDVNLRRLNVLVSECFLCFDDAAGIFRNYAGEGVPELMDMQMFDACFARVFFDLTVEAVRGKTRFIAERIISAPVDLRRFRTAVESDPESFSLKILLDSNDFSLRFYMDDEGKKNIKRLLFTEEPFDDESFIGYIMRLAELNEIPELRWILKLAGMEKLYDYRYKFSSDFRVDTAPLSKLTGVGEIKLKNLLYLHEQGRRRHIVGNLVVFNEPIQHHFVVREKPKLCPVCLSENNYCRRIWEISPVTACPVHECLLIQNCPKCGRSLSWSRPKINVCQCEFDFRSSKMIFLPPDELRLGEFIHQRLGLPCSFREKLFKYPLNTLPLRDLLTLLFFIAAHFAEMPDYTGAGLSNYKTNQEIHYNLCRSLEIFDDWAKSFYEFIRSWKKQEITYFINCKQLYLSKVELPREYGEYELLNQILHNVLFEKQFSFMHEQFKEYLLRLKSGDFSSQPNLFDKLDL